MHHHKYRRVNIARKGNPPYFVMQCQTCPSYSPMKTKLSAPTLVGKIAICNKCENKFELSRRALRMSKPVCDDCVGVANKVVVSDPFEELEKILREDGD